MKSFTKEMFKNPMFYLVVFIIGVSMRLFDFSGGLWIDEIWSMVASAPELSVKEIINACKTDSHPPFFDIMLHYFLVLFGDEDINGRLLA